METDLKFDGILVAFIHDTNNRAGCEFFFKASH